MKNITKRGWRLSIAILGGIILAIFLLQTTADAFAAERWSAGDPDSGSAPYIGKDTEAGCEVLTYRGLTVWRLSKAFGVHQWLIIFVNELDHSTTIIKKGEWLLIPDRKCGRADWKYLDPPKDHGRIVQGARASFFISA